MIGIKLQKGVTLIELIIVLTVFTLILGTTASIFISVLNNQRRTLQEQELFNQTSYAIEYISRLVSDAVKDDDGSCLGSNYAGYNYLLTHFNSSDSFYEGIKFITKDDVCQEFFLDSDAVFKEKKDSNDAQNILSDSFNVIYARFIINGDKTLEGSSDEDSIQPRITFVLDVKNKEGQEKVIQTTVSQRNLNEQQ